MSALFDKVAPKILHPMAGLSRYVGSVLRWFCPKCDVPMTKLIARGPLNAMFRCHKCKVVWKINR